VPRSVAAAASRDKTLLVEPPVDLTLPEPGSSTTRRILGAYLKRTVTDFLRIPAGRFHSEVADDFTAIRAVVERLSRSAEAGLVFSILRRVTVSTLVRCIDAELWGGGDVGKLDAWLAELDALVAFELARAGALPASGLRLRRAPRRIVSLATRTALTLPAERTVVFSPGRITLEQGASRFDVDLDDLKGLGPGDVTGRAVSQPYHPIAHDLLLAEVDNNPLSSVEAHPEKQGNAVDLGGRTAAEWTEVLRNALERVEKYLPDLAEEMRLVMQLLVPVGYDAERHLSASYAEAIGTAYLSLHPDPMTMTEALIHEFSHNKLNALFRLDPILENAFNPLFSSPVRPDPRPLYGVLLAVHAFTPVARLYELMTEAGDPLSTSPAFTRRYGKIVEGNHEAVVTLSEHAKATPVGRGILDELQRWDAHYARSGH